MAVVPPGSVECAPELTHFFHPESSAAILICYSAMDKPSCNLLLRISRLMKRRYNRSWNMKVMVERKRPSFLLRISSIRHELAHRWFGDLVT